MNVSQPMAGPGAHNKAGRDNCAFSCQKSKTQVHRGGGAARACVV